MFHELFRPPALALTSLLPLIGPRAVAATLWRESDFKRKSLRPCARPIDPATLDALYDPYRRPDACRAAALTWSAYKRGLGDVVRARWALPHARLRLLDDVGRFTPTEAPTEVAGELNRLLQRAE